MRKIGDDVIRPMVRALADAPVHLGQLKEVATRLKRKQSHNREGVDDIDKFDDKPDGPKTLKDAMGRRVTRVDRTGNELLYRIDHRRPDDIFENGFEVWEPSNNNLEDFVNTARFSNFVSTTRDPYLYRRWGDARYRYTVDAPGGIDVDATFPKGPFGPSSDEPEFEIAFQGGIAAKRVVGAHPILPEKIEHVVGAHPILPGKILGEWIPNPNHGGDG